MSHPQPSLVIHFNYPSAWGSQISNLTTASVSSFNYTIKFLRVGRWHSHALQAACPSTFFKRFATTCSFARVFRYLWEGSNVSYRTDLLACCRVSEWWNGTTRLSCPSQVRPTALDQKTMESDVVVLRDLKKKKNMSWLTAKICSSSGMLALISDDEGRREEGKRPRKEKGKWKYVLVVAPWLWIIHTKTWDEERLQTRLSST
jgi:hypothetical protein